MSDFLASVPPPPPRIGGRSPSNTPLTPAPAVTPFTPQRVLEGNQGAPVRNEEPTKVVEAVEVTVVPDVKGENPLLMPPVQGNEVKLSRKEARAEAKNLKASKKQNQDNKKVKTKKASPDQEEVPVKKKSSTVKILFLVLLLAVAVSLVYFNNAAILEVYNNLYQLVSPASVEAPAEPLVPASY